MVYKKTKVYQLIKNVFNIIIILYQLFLLYTLNLTKCTINLITFLFFQDTVQALVADCENPAVKRMKNVEAFMHRCKCFILSFYY